MTELLINQTYTICKYSDVRHCKNYVLQQYVLVNLKLEMLEVFWMGFTGCSDSVWTKTILN